MTIIRGHWTTHADGRETALYVGQSEKGGLYILAADKKTVLKKCDSIYTVDDDLEEFA